MLSRWIMTVLLLLSATAQAQKPLQPRTRYVLRAGDAVTLDYRYTPECNQTITLQPDGYVDLALIGSVHAAGLTLDLLHDLVVQRARTPLKDRMCTFFARSMGSHRSSSAELEARSEQPRPGAGHNSGARGHRSGAAK